MTCNELKVREDCKKRSNLVFDEATVSSWLNKYTHEESSVPERKIKKGDNFYALVS